MTQQVITEIIGLHRDFPAWAVWLPDQGRPWTAIHAASARAPAPDLPMIWVHADTAAKLASRMQDADAQLADREPGSDDARHERGPDPSSAERSRVSAYDRFPTVQCRAGQRA